MDAQSYLTPDQRWTIWGCNSHQEYHDKFFIKGKFHPMVPDKIRSSYETVERLISYSYFYYPLTEEVISKMTRIFEMAVRIRAKALDIKGKVLSDIIHKLKINTDVDEIWAEEWLDLKKIRNLYAHPEGPNYLGPMSLRSVIPIVNILNSIFCPKTLLSDARDKTSAWKQKFDFYSKGVYVLEMDSNRVIVTCAVPITVNLDENKSLWYVEPVGLKFPQNMDEYFDFNPILLCVSDITIVDVILCGTDYRKGLAFKIRPTVHPDDLNYTKDYFNQQSSAQEQVRILHNQNTNYHLYYDREKFIYDEFWEKSS